MAAFSFTLTINDTNLAAKIAAFKRAFPAQQGETNTQLFNRFVLEKAIDTFKEGMKLVAQDGIQAQITDPGVTVT